jgi:hypothetical protein
MGEPAVIPLVEAVEDNHYFSIHSEIIKALGSIGEPAIQVII